jgi:hypothetical protein
MNNVTCGQFLATKDAATESLTYPLSCSSELGYEKYSMYGALQNGLIALRRVNFLKIAGIPFPGTKIAQNLHKK